MKTMRNRTNQKGVMLLEALLGILLFSVGILAVVGMQAMAVKNVAESKYRMDASFLANQIIGEMWINRTNLASYAYAGTGTPPAVDSAWVARVNNSLPGSTTNPPTIVIAGNSVTITVFWQHPEEAHLNPPPPPHNLTVIASIDCC